MRTIREHFGELGGDFLADLERRGVPLDATDRELTREHDAAILDAFERIMEPEEFEAALLAVLGLGSPDDPHQQYWNALLRRGRRDHPSPRTRRRPP